MSNYYSEFSTFLTEAVKKDDVKVASALLEHLMPLVDPANVDQIESVRKSVLRSGSTEMIALFMRHHTIKDEDAFTYVSSRLIDKTLERSGLDSMIASVGKFYGVALAGSIATGDFEVLNKLKAAFGSKAVTSAFGHTSSRGIVVDNVFFRGENYSQPPLSREHLIQLIDEAYELGLMPKRNSDGYARNYLFDKSNLSAVEEWPVHRCKQLPVISKGTIKNPELIMAFDEHAQRHPAMKKMYDRVPVLIADSELKDYPFARIFYPVNTVIAYIGGDTRRHVSRQYNQELFAEFNLKEFFSEYESLDADGKNKLIERVDGYEMSVRARDASSDNSKSILSDELIISKLAPERYLTGFIGTDNLVLCMVDVQSAMALEMADYSQENMSEARWEARDLITPSTVSGLVCVSNYHGVDEQDISARNCTYYSSKLVDLISSSKVAHCAIRENIGKELLIHLTSKSWGAMNGRAHAFMQQEYGVTIPYTFKIEEKNLVKELHEAGYKFDPATKCEVNSWSISDVDSCLKLIEMGCWPDNKTPEPEDLIDGLKASVRKPDNVALTAYLLHHGAEAVCSVTKSLPQWERVRKLFHDQPETLARYAPNSIKRELLNGSMDI